jgi:hypothetical protein
MVDYPITIIIRPLCMSSLDSTALSVDGAWSDPTVDEHAVDGEDAVPTGLRLRVQTDVRLALPKDQDTSIAIQNQDPPERHYRAILYVNGWQWVTTCRSDAHNQNGHGRVLEMRRLYLESPAEFVHRYLPHAGCTSRRLSILTATPLVFMMLPCAPRSPSTRM